MIKVYCLEKHFYFQTHKTTHVANYAFWKVNDYIESWLASCCIDKWQVSCDIDFTWGIHDHWMNECIDNIVGNRTLPTDLKYWPFSICRPHLRFTSPQDAILFKLTW